MDKIWEFIEEKTACKVSWDDEQHLHHHYQSNGNDNEQQTPAIVVGKNIPSFIRGHLQSLKNNANSRKLLNDIARVFECVPYNKKNFKTVTDNIDSYGKQE